MAKEDKLYKEVMDHDFQMVQEKNLYEPVLQDIIDLVLTHQPDLKGDNDKGKNRSEMIFDGTPRSALGIATNGTYGLMVAPTMRWFKIKIGDEALNDRSDVRLWLQDTEDRLYSAFNRSNFYSTMKSYIMDGYSIGTACMFSQEDIATGKIYYSTIPIRDFRIALDEFGNVNRLHRDLKMTAGQIAKRFGKDSLTPKMKQALDKTDQRGRLEKFDLLHAVFPRTDTDLKSINKLNKPQASIWLSKDAKEDGTHTLLESGLNTFPYSLWRFDKETGETYGRSPAWSVMSEIKGAHLIEEDLIKAVELVTKPPANVHSNNMGNFERIPNAVNYFGDPSEKADFMNLQINFPATFEHQERKRKLINEAYFVDFFLLISSRPQTKTATEVLELQGEKISVLSPVVTSLSTEALDHIVERTFSIEFEAGRLLPPPEILAGENFDIEYLGPLAQLQKMRFETRGIQQAIENTRPIVELNPSVLDNVDMDGLYRDTLVGSGFPETRLKSEDVRDAERQARAEAEAKILQAQTAETESKAFKNMTQGDKNLDGKISDAAAEGTA